MMASLSALPEWAKAVLCLGLALICLALIYGPPPPRPPGPPGWR